MDLRDPPLGGGRGADPNDVVVWFGGDDTRTGWSQRILTLEGVRRRGGNDPHSKHVAAAKAVVASFYELPVEGEAEHSSVGEGTRVVCGALHPKQANDSTSELRVPLVLTRGVLRSHRLVRDTRRRGQLLMSTPTESQNEGEPKPAILDEADNSGNTSCDHSGLEPTPSPVLRSSILKRDDECSADYGRPQVADHTASHKHVRDSLVLHLKRQCELNGTSASATAATPSSMQEPSLRPTSTPLQNSSGSSRRASRVCRPRSASSAGTTVSNAVGDSEKKMPSPAAARAAQGRGMVPESVSDFPTVGMCRDMNATIALRRAAAVIDRVDGKLPTSATYDALRKSLGTSIMHTIRSTNAQQHHEATAASQIRGGLSLYDVLEGGLSATSLASTMSTKQRETILRDVYRFLPKEEVARMQLRDRLESMQTNFARRDIEADLDAFKMIQKRGMDSKSNAGGSGKAAATSSVTVEGGRPSSSTVLLTDLLKQRSVEGQRRLARSVATGSRLQKSGETLHSSSHVYRTSGPSESYRSDKYHHDGGATAAHIPAQSRITLNGKVYTYSEWFRSTM